MFEFIKKPKALNEFMAVAVLMTDETILDWAERPEIYGHIVSLIAKLSLKTMMDHHERWGTEPGEGEAAGALIQHVDALNSKQLAALTEAVARWTLVGNKA